MSNQTIRILLVEDEPGDASILCEELAQAAARFELVRSGHIANALQRLDEERFDLVLLDLSLSDSQQLGSFLRARPQEAGAPIVVLTALDDETLAVRAVAEGAQDYLVKGQVSGSALARAIRYAIERHEKQQVLIQQALLDDLTGLYNRRGFLALAEEQFKLNRRANRGLLLFFIDLDELKRINDTYGHQSGSQALIDTAQVLKSTFRDSDVIGRLGGDEFTVLAIEADGDSAEAIYMRLQARLDEHNAQAKRIYHLSFSAGVARFDPDDPLSIEELIDRADKAMYRQKRSKHAAHIQLCASPNVRHTSPDRSNHGDDTGRRSA
jgi:diguanylate cyclase (GGDEF)-like protein